MTPKITRKGMGTDMMKMFTVVRIFLESYFKGAKNNRFYRPVFAENALELWYGLSETERNQVLNMARKDNLIGLEDLLRKIDDEDAEKYVDEKAE
jgi:hypothetical protein